MQVVDVIKLQCPKCKDTHGLTVDDYSFQHEWREPAGTPKKKGYKIHYIAVYTECLNCNTKYHSDAYLT